MNLASIIRAIKIIELNDQSYEHIRMIIIRWTIQMEGPWNVGVVEGH